MIDRGIKKAIIESGKKLGEVAKDRIKENVKEEIDKRMSGVYRKLRILIWTVSLVIFGIVLIMVGIVQFLSRIFPGEWIFLIVGLIIILFGLLIPRIMEV